MNVIKKIVPMVVMLTGGLLCMTTCSKAAGFTQLHEYSVLSPDSAKSADQPNKGKLKMKIKMTRADISSKESALARKEKKGITNTDRSIRENEIKDLKAKLAGYEKQLEEIEKQEALEQKQKEEAEKKQE